ncbi:hypothetical protein LCGC14_1324610 [marine sediment metagenome]|uniref:Methyltransferase domain-containing protein n=1 Tax=marine sediment metagenome TaxID=412755 RepID=A0A0F9NKX2_9ZZZZ
MKRIRKRYKEFWAGLALIQLKEALAESAELAEVYQKESQFIRKVLQLSPSDKVLDLGCGTGEHCFALTEQGIDATGIDIAQVLVDHASERSREAGLSATFLSADMRTFRPETQFDAVFTSSGTFGLYESDADNRSVLRTIRAVLADGGRFLIGPSGPALLGQRSYSEKDWYFVGDGCFLRESAWDQSTALFRESFLFIDQDGTVIEFGGFDDASDGQYSRVYSLEQLQEMIAEVGLRFDAAYGSFELPPKPHGADTPRLLIVGHKA